METLENHFKRVINFNSFIDCMNSRTILKKIITMTHPLIKVKRANIWICLKQSSVARKQKTCRVPW